MIKLSDYVIQRVAEQGVKHVFFVPGGGAMHLNDSLGRHKEIDFISNLHEQASAIAAEAYARVTGGLGVCMVTSGPGGTNSITGLMGAWLDSTPCLFLSGQVKRPDLKTGTGVRQLGSQEVDIVTIVSSMTKYAVTITDPASIAYHLDKALHLVYEGRPGPVWIDIPLDVQAAMVDPATMPRFTPEVVAKPNAKDELYALARKTMQMLAASERPVMMAGNGIRVAGAVKEFAQLIEVLGIPVQTTWLGLDLIADAHPLFAERPGAIAPRGANFTLQNADFFLCIGARLDMAQVGYSHERFARGAKKVVCDIDAAEIGKLGKMNIDLPVVADARAFIQALLDVAPEFAPVDRAAWLARVTDCRKRYPLGSPHYSTGREGVSLYSFSSALSDAIPEHTVIAAGSSGFACEIFYLMLRIKTGQRCYHNRGTGAMGFALPSAIGACFASGKKQVVSVDGDGGFQFNIQELATVASHQLPIKFFVVNNQGYASIRSSQVGYFEGNLVGADASSGLVFPDLQKIVAAYGLRAHKIRHGDDVAAEVRKVLAMDGPVVCEVEVLPDEPREPRLSSFRRADGSMASKPLEDLLPFLDREEFKANMITPIIED